MCYPYQERALSRYTHNGHHWQFGADAGMASNLHGNLVVLIIASSCFLYQAGISHCWMLIPHLKYQPSPPLIIDSTFDHLAGMSYPTIEQLESLKSALLNGLPFCNGTIRLCPENYLLFFTKGDDGQWVSTFFFFLLYIDADSSTVVV